MNNNLVVNFLYALCAGVIACCYLLPQLQYFVRIQELAVLSFLFSVIFIFRGRTSTDVFNIMVGAIPYLLISFVVAYPFNLKYGIVHPLLLLWNTIFPALLCKSILARNNKTITFVLIGLSVCIFLYVGWQTIIQTADNQNIARMMTNGDTDEDVLVEMKLMGVGGFGAAYSSGVYAIVAAVMLLHFALKKIERYILILILFITLYYAFNAMFTTLILITIASFATIIIYRKKRNILYIPFFFLVLFILLPSLLQLAIEFEKGTPVADHLHDIYMKLYGTVSATSERDQFMKENVEAMIDSPLWGHDISDGYYKYLTRNSHSTFWSIIINTGLIGAVSYFSVYVKAYRSMKVNVSRMQEKQIYLPLIVYFILLAFFNPSDSFEVSWALFFVAPLTYSTYVLKKQSI